MFVHPYLPGHAYPLTHSSYPPVLTSPLAHPPTHSCPHLSSRSGPHRSTTLRGASTRNSSSPEPSTSQQRCYEGDLRPRLTLRITRKVLSSVLSLTLIHFMAWTSLRVEPSHVPPLSSTGKMLCERCTRSALLIRCFIVDMALIVSTICSGRLKIVSVCCKLCNLFTKF
jgi:hypothetical protein